MNPYKSHLCLVGLALCALFIASCITITQTPRETNLGTNRVSVVPYCRDASTHSLRDTEADGSSKVVYYEFTCGETIVRLDGDALTVNGKLYGSVSKGDTIAVNYGSVRVNGTARAAK